MPPGTDHGRRRQQVADRILEVARAEIARFGQRGAGNIWKTANGAADYIVGALARKRLGATQDRHGDGGYRALGQRLQGLAPAVQGIWKRRAFNRRALEIERSRKH